MSTARFVSPSLKLCRVNQALPHGSGNGAVLMVGWGWGGGGGYVCPLEDKSKVIEKETLSRNCVDVVLSIGQVMQDLE